MASAARGGGADHLREILPRLEEGGIEPYLITGDDGDLPQWARRNGIGCSTIDLMRHRANPARALELRRSLGDLEPSVVHYHGTRAAFYGTLGQVLPRAWKTVYTAHGLAFRKETLPVRKGIFSLAERLACYGADHVVSVSSSDLRELRLRGYIRSGGTYIPNAVDTDVFRPREGVEARKELGISKEAFVVGTVSRLVPQKGIKWLIEAMGYCPSMELIVVGDGEERRALEKQVGQDKDRIRFLGTREDIPALLSAFDVFALSSLWEGQPIALIEALAAGVPCVATGTEGAREVLKEIEGGLIVPKCDAEGLAGAFHQLRSDSKLRLRLAKGAREGALLRSHEATVQNLLSLYRSLIKH